MSKQDNTASARDRILETASDLFYTQGYRATGINEVIKQSGVAKATFYNHFPSKDDLCLAYLELHSLAEKQSISGQIQARRNPKAKFMAIIEAIETWLESNNLRGCEYLNTVAEVPDPASPLRRKGRQHYGWLRDLIREQAEALIASDPEKYGKLQVAQLTDDYMVIMVGAIALTEVYHETWPVKHAIKMVARLIE